MSVAAASASPSTASPQGAKPASGASSAPPSPELPRANRVIHIPDFHLEDRLTEEHVDYFETYGFIRFKRFVQRERAAELYGSMLEITDKLVREGRTKINGVPLIQGKRDDGSPYFGRTPFASLLHPEFSRFLRDPRFQAIVDDLAPGSRLGEDERDGLVVNRFRNERGAKYKNLGWHTDSLRDLFYLEKPRRYLNVGFYITDSPLHVGGLRVLPCSHIQPITSLLTRKRYFVDMEPDPYELAVTAEAGDLTIHDGRIWHRTALATVTGDASERCVTYLPIMDGPIKRKTESSSTPVYFHLKKIVGY